MFSREVGLRDAGGADLLVGLAPVLPQAIDKLIAFTLDGQRRRSSAAPPASLSAESWPDAPD